MIMANKVKFKDKVIKQIKQKSTWRGIALLLGVTGVSVAPSLVMEIGMAVASIIGAIEVAHDESKKR